MKIGEDFKIICKALEFYNLDANKLTEAEFYLILLEDRRFFSHPGFDLIAIFRALFRRIVFKEKSGASTIEQQLVRTITNRREKKISRKSREIILATMVSLKFEKMTVISAYIDLAYKGFLTKNKLEFLMKFENQTEYYTPEILKASCIRYPFPKSLNERWMSKICQRAKYATFLKNRLVCGLNFGPYRISINKFRVFMFSKKLINFSSRELLVKESFKRNIFLSPKINKI